MASDDKAFEFSGYADADTVADYLESLARQIRKGNAQLTSGASSINLEFGSPIKIEIEAEMEARKGKGSLELELSWRQIVTSEGGIVIQDAQDEPEEIDEEVEPVGAGLTVGDNAS